MYYRIYLKPQKLQPWQQTIFFCGDVFTIMLFKHDCFLKSVSITFKC